MPTKPLVIDRLTGWHVLAALCAGAVGVAVTWNAWQEIYMFATRDEEASHIFLVIPVALYMIWVRRMRLRHCRPSGTIIGPIMVGFGWWLSYYGFNFGKTYFYDIGALVIVLGCMFSVLGKQALFRFFPAVAVLVFLAPIPGTIRQAIALPLQSETAKIAQTLLDVMGVKTELSGNQLSINHVPVTIVEACNGMRMVFPLFLITYAFSFRLPLRNGVRWFVLLMSPITAIVCNVLRTLPLIWLYGNGSRNIADRFHDYSGWLMLPIAFCLLLAVIRLLEWLMLPVKRYTLASQ